MIGAFTVESIDGHKREVGAASLTNFQYNLKMQGYLTQMGIWRHVNAIPQCREMIASYRAAVLSTDPSAFNPTRKYHSVNSIFTGLVLYICYFGAFIFIISD